MAPPSEAAIAGWRRWARTPTSAGDGRQGVERPQDHHPAPAAPVADLLRELKDAPDHAILRVVREVRDDW